MNGFIYNAGDLKRILSAVPDNTTVRFTIGFGSNRRKLLSLWSYEAEEKDEIDGKLNALYVRGATILPQDEKLDDEGFVHDFELIVLVEDLDCLHEIDEDKMIKESIERIKAMWANAE